MKNGYMRELIAQRIGGNQFGSDTVLYKFEKIKRAKRAAMKAHPDVPIIDLGVGEPDAMADRGVIEALYREALRWENRDYADNGIDAFKKAACRYLDEVYGVADIRAESEINHAIGSKSALAMLAQAFIDPGDILLTTIPGYGILANMTRWLGGSVYELPLTEGNGFLPDLKSIPEETAQKAKLLYINYPNNPTGASATGHFYRRVVAFAEKHRIAVVQDAAYAALTFHGEKPLSFLSIPGAKDVGVEVHSLSKAFNMTGWRIAFIAGNEWMVSAFAAVKDSNDSGQFKPIQYAGVYAMEHPEITRQIAEKYARRHAMLADLLKKLGFDARIPKASFYQYVRIPTAIRGGCSFENAEAFSQYLIREKQISVVPWDEAGHYIRMSVTFKADGMDEERKIMGEIERRLSDTPFTFV